MQKAFQKKRTKKYLAPVKKADPNLTFDYKDVRVLQRFVNETGSILARDRTGLSAKQQRQLSREVKRARHLALLPFTQTL